MKDDLLTKTSYTFRPTALNITFASATRRVPYGGYAKGETSNDAPLLRR